jgi:hypothetical protein
LQRAILLPHYYAKEWAECYSSDQRPYQKFLPAPMLFLKMEAYTLVEFEDGISFWIGGSDVRRILIFHSVSYPAAGVMVSLKDISHGSGK